MLNYDTFKTAVQYSPEWNTAEIAVLSRAFELKHLKCFSRGPRKNMIDIASPGVESKPSSLETGQFEWAVVLQAWKTNRKRYLLETSGWMTDWCAKNPFSGRLELVSERLGAQAAFAIAVWNELGSNWPDLWDFYHSEADKTHGTRAEPFLCFFRTVQEARRSWHPRGVTESVKLTQAIIDQILYETSYKRRAPFASGSPMSRILLGCEIHQQSIKDFENIIEGRFQTKETLSKFFEEFMASIGEGMLVESAARLPLRSADVLRCVERLKNFIRSQQIDIRDEKVLGFGKFNVHYVSQGEHFSLQPRITLEESLRENPHLYMLCLCHEIGHLVYHSSWKAELSLADFVIDYFNRQDLKIALGLTILKGKVQKDLTRNYSAVEITADEFAFDLLLPEEYIQAEKDRYTTSDGIYFPGLELATMGTLGLEDFYPEQSRFGRIRERFSKIVQDIVFPKIQLYVKVFTGRDIRKACRNVSERRLEKALDLFWSEASAIVSGQSLPVGTRRTQRLDLTAEPGFYFEGILCR